MARDRRGRWLPGASPNPGGRPQGKGLKAEIERVLGEKPTGYGRQTRLERMARTLVAKAEDGDLRALELLLRRLWPERIAIENEGVPVVEIRDFSGREVGIDRHKRASGLASDDTPAAPPGSH